MSVAGSSTLKGQYVCHYTLLKVLVACAQLVMPRAYLSAQTLPAGTVTPQNSSDLLMPPFNAHLLINLTQPLLPSGQLRRACQL